MLWILLHFHLHHHILSFTASLLSPSLINFFFSFASLLLTASKQSSFFFFLNHKKVFSELASVSLSCDCDSFFATFFTSELLVGFITHNVVSQLLCFMLASYSASYAPHFHSTCMLIACWLRGSCLLSSLSIASWGPCSIATCRGPAPTDPGYSKERWPRRLFIC